MPLDFVLDLLYPLPVRTNKMFGTVAIYHEEKVILATKRNEAKPLDDGIWVATKLEHHAELKSIIPELRELEIYKIKSWLVLREEEDNFEERAEQIVDLIKSKSPLIGNIPKPKKKKNHDSRSHLK